MTLDICNRQSRPVTAQPSNLTLRQRSIISHSLMYLPTAFSQTDILLLVMTTVKKKECFSVQIIFESTLQISTHILERAVLKYLKVTLGYS